MIITIGNVTAGVFGDGNTILKIADDALRNKKAVKRADAYYSEADRRNGYSYSIHSA